MHLRESRASGGLERPPDPRPLLALRYALATQDAQKCSASPKKAPTFKFLAKSLVQTVCKRMGTSVRVGTLLCSVMALTVAVNLIVSKMF